MITGGSAERRSGLDRGHETGADQIQRQVRGHMRQKVRGQNHVSPTVRWQSRDGHSSQGQRGTEFVQAKHVEDK